MQASRSEPKASEAHEDRLAAPALALLLTAIALSAAVPSYIPTHDGPQHTYALHVANHLDDPARGWSDWFEIARPVTSLGFAALFGPLDLWLPWPIALRAALTALALFWAIAAWTLARALHPQRAWLGLALGGAAFSWPFYMGFFSFHLASSFGLLVLAWAIARRPETPGQIALLAALLGGVALLHVISGAITGGVLAALYWRRAPRGARAAACVRIAAIGLPTAAVALALVAPGFDTLGEPGAPPPAYQTEPWWALAKCFTGGPAWRAWPLTLLALAAPLVALARRAAPRSAEDDALLFAGGAALVAAAWLPMDLRSWEFFAPRFLPIGVGALVLTLPIERLAGARRAIAAASLAGFALASTAWAWTYHERFAAASADALSGLDAGIVRSGVRLPIVFETGADPRVPPARAAMPFALPWVNLGQLYAASQGGITPYGFTLNPRMHALVPRPGAAAHAPARLDRTYLAELTSPGRGEDPAFRAALLTYLASRGVEFEDVIFYGRPEEADRLRALGFAEDWRRGGLSIARFRGCPVRVHVSPAIAASGALALETGWLPAWNPHARYELARGEALDDGSRMLALRETCAGLWLRLAESSAVCDGADAAGRLAIASTQATPDVICRERGEHWTPTALARRGDPASAGAAIASRPAPSGSAARAAARNAR
jgi:hypothetical protein